MRFPANMGARRHGVIYLTLSSEPRYRSCCYYCALIPGGGETISRVNRTVAARDHIPHLEVIVAQGHTRVREVGVHVSNVRCAVRVHGDEDQRLSEHIHLPKRAQSTPSTTSGTSHLPCSRRAAHMPLYNRLHACSQPFPSSRTLTQPTSMTYTRRWNLRRATSRGFSMYLQHTAWRKRV